MIVKEYFLKFVILSRHATSLVSNSSDKMSKFLTGITGDVEKCRSVKLHNNMDLSRLMVHVQQVEDNQKNRVSLML